MKVLLISPLPPPVGGMATWTEMYRSFCKNKGIECSVVNTALVGSRQKNFESKRKILDEAQRAKNIIRDLTYKINSFEPDVVHINTSCSRYGLLRDAICAWKAKQHNAKIVLHCHCTVQDMLGTSRLANKVLAWMARRVDCVVTINSNSTNFIEALAGTKLVKQVPNFLEAKENCQRVSCSYGIDNILFVGHVRKEKGMKELSEVAEAFPNKTFHVIGPVFDEMKSWQWPDNVRIYGEMGHEQVFQQLKQADIFFFPSHSEGFSVAMLEAMFVGLPIIASDVGANQDMIANAGGIIVPPGDVQGFIDSIRKMEDKEYREQMSEWNYQKVRNEYMPDRVLNKLFSIYKQL